MGVVTEHDYVHGDLTLYEFLWPEGRPEGCFSCLAALDWSGPVVFWAGAPHRIALHIACAERLGMNLIKDAREAELMNGDYPARSAAITNISLLQRQLAEEVEGQHN